MYKQIEITLRHLSAWLPAPPSPVHYSVCCPGEAPAGALGDLGSHWGDTFPLSVCKGFLSPRLLWSRDPHSYSGRYAVWGNISPSFYGGEIRGQECHTVSQRHSQRALFSGSPRKSSSEPFPSWASVSPFVKWRMRTSFYFLVLSQAII